MDTADNVVSKISSRVRDKEIPWRNDTVHRAIKERNEIRKLGDRENQIGMARNEEKLKELNQLYRNSKLKLKRIISAEKQKT